MTSDQQLAASLTVRGGKGAWLVDGLDEPVGPYRTKAEARECKAGLQRFLRNHHKRAYVTTEQKRKDDVR